ncbi:MAG: hypothetical protein LBU32_26745 [Clostridiales bacterium]|nr:hypothetical protein [Clostridiales bacterium]
MKQTWVASFWQRSEPTLTWKQLSTWQVVDEPIRPNMKRRMVYNEYYKSYCGSYDNNNNKMAALSKLAQSFQ